jgi:hypothetical protein
VPYNAHCRIVIIYTQILDIIKIRDILTGVFFHGVEPCQSLTAYCSMNGAYAPLPAAIPPPSRPSCRILPARWSATSTTRLWMATSAKATARSPTLRACANIIFYERHFTAIIIRFVALGSFDHAFYPYTPYARTCPDEIIENVRSHV